MTNNRKGTVNGSIAVTAIFKEDADGHTTVECPEIPGCIVTGCSRADAARKIEAAVKACLEQLLWDARKRLRSGRIRTAGNQ